MLILGVGVMSMIDDDINGVKDVIENKQFGVSYEQYGRIYFASNESCHEKIPRFNVKNKDVLCVLASGDQSFYFLENGARTVDLFDVNKLALYYYYLRIWNIRYNSSFYFNENSIKEDISRLLKVVNPNNETEKYIYNFWLKCISVFSSDEIRMMFYYDTYEMKETYKSTDLLNNRLKDSSFTFYNIDISKKADINRKYDIIYTSNISGYLSIASLKIYESNMWNLLKNNGVIISTGINELGMGGDEKNIMCKNFRGKVLKERFGTDFSLYCFKKRKIKTLFGDHHE